MARRAAEVEASRRLTVGAEPIPGRGVHFRVWAPRPKEIALVLEGGPGSGGRGRVVRLKEEADGYFSALVPRAAAGTFYRYLVDGRPLPDPASRFQPEGPEGPSMVVDPGAFAWSDHDWKGVRIRGQVLYEMHVGTFTQAGNWRAAAEGLADLADLGVTAVELMPLNEFPGRFGWGYDGVNLFAPFHPYGTPDDFRRFVDEAHKVGLGVILDVVYNHLGPSGNTLLEFASEYLSDTYITEWGSTCRFDGPSSEPVRAFFLANARYWIEEFHLDGFRIDATQSLFDSSEDHILAALAREAREAAGGRSILVIAENEEENSDLVRPKEQGGYGLDAVWNEDFHHVAVSSVTRRREAYYGDYHASPQELVSLAKHGFLYQGQWQVRQRKTRGRPSFDIPRERLVNYLENHDQIANSLRSAGLHQMLSPAALRAITAYFLLSPGTPLLFQGQEFGSSSPFLYFGDLEPQIAARMLAGRRSFLSQFEGLKTGRSNLFLPLPSDPETFRRCKLDRSERGRRSEVYALHRDLLQLRRDDPVLSQQGEGGLDGAVLGPETFVLRHFGGQGDDRLVLVNLGSDVALQPVTEPLLRAALASSLEADLVE